MIQPPYEEFEREAAQWPVVPVMREILADLETPVSAFRKLASGRHAALLESVEGGETWGRYSMVGLDPSLVFESKGRQVRITRRVSGGRGEGDDASAGGENTGDGASGGVASGGSPSGRVAGRDLGVSETEEIWEEDRPLQVLDRILAEHRTASIAGLPRLAGGAVGYVAYDTVREFERLPRKAADDLQLPDARFVLFEAMLLFDNQAHTVKVVVNGRHHGNPREAYARALARIEEITTALSRPDDSPPPPVSSAPLEFRSSVSREDYIAAVKKAKEYIRSGDVVQVVLSHRLQADGSMDPFDVYRALRVINPSPYLFFLRLDDLTLVGSSPEVLVRREGMRVETRPIAGTRPRGEGETADRLLEKELLASEKERAEHLMLVDLGRNDLGRICRYGSVETTEFMKVERYSHVMHLVSHVVGELAGEDGEGPPAHAAATASRNSEIHDSLAPGRTGQGDTGIGSAARSSAARSSAARSSNVLGNAEILEACFPAGTVSGAPKIRAMEIIEELEPVRRGVYAGAIGYVDFHGNMDTCIAIRTLLFHEGTIYLGVGAGIVADSDPEAEYEETVRKGSALIRACDLAREGLASFSRARAQMPHPDEILRVGQRAATQSGEEAKG